MLHFGLASKFPDLNLKACSSIDCPKLIFSWREKLKKKKTANLASAENGQAYRVHLNHLNQYSSEADSHWGKNK